MQAKKYFCLIMFCVVLCDVLPGCGKKDSQRNNKFTYGTLENNNIESVYELSGGTSQFAVKDFSNQEIGSVDIGMVNLSETADGGVVAWGSNIYVYSPDKNDKNQVHKEAALEILKKSNQ